MGYRSWYVITSRWLSSFLIVRMSWLLCKSEAAKRVRATFRLLEKTA